MSAAVQVRTQEGIVEVDEGAGWREANELERSALATAFMPALGDDPEFATDEVHVLAVAEPLSPGLREHWRELVQGLIRKGIVSGPERTGGRGGGEAAGLLRKELYDCFVATGAEPEEDGNWRRLNPGEALAAVRELRAEVDAEQGPGALGLLNAGNVVDGGGPLTEGEFKRTVNAAARQSNFTPPFPEEEGWP